MKLVAMKCLSCGANIDLNSDKKVAYCPYCGAKMLIDDEIQRVELSGKVEVSGIPTLDRLCINAETFIGIGDFKNADRIIEEIYKNYPNDYRGYFLALLRKTRSETYTHSALSDTPKYNVYSFYNAIPRINDLCRLANKALHFAPEEKKSEIKDMAGYWLMPLKRISEDARAKVQEYYRLEEICHVQEQVIKQKIDDANSVYASEEAKKRRLGIGAAVSLAVFILGFFMVLVHPAFSLLCLAGLISTILFLISYFIAKSHISKMKRNIIGISSGLNRIMPENGHSFWPDNQGSPEYISEALDTYFSSLNRFCESK